MTDLRRELGFALELADLADAITLPAFRRGGEPDVKADGTWVTAADRDTEQALRRAIRDVFPQHAVLGEEEGLDGPEDAPTWILDPIDATTNFVKGNPIFATIIGLRIDGRDVLGVVSAPALGSRWTGAVGHGATQDGRPIRVSGVDRLEDAEVALGGLDYFAEGPYAHVLDRVARSTARQRGYGDFWQHCLVAAGSTDVAMEAAVSTWDVAAIKAIVEAAGGRFTDLAGNDTADGGTALSSNGLLHDAALRLVADDAAGDVSTGEPS